MPGRSSLSSTVAIVITPKSSNYSRPTKAAWRTKVREIWTIDSDFMVYRLPDRSRFRVIPGGRG